MATARKWRVARFDIIIDPAFDARMRSEPDFELRLSPVPKSDEEVTRALAGADVYHVSSARNEMAQYAFVTPGLLDRNPHVLAGGNRCGAQRAACGKKDHLIDKRQHALQAMLD